MNSRLTIALCITLHAILVLIFAAILATYEAGVYNRPLALSSTTTRTVITIVSQSFTIAYCAILALLTQRLTLHDFIKRPQTLTAIHDKSSAWLGLGSSLQTLTRQRKLISDILGVFMITLYLLLIFVVHTTLPDIFGITAQNVTTLATYPTTLGRQSNISGVLTSGDASNAIFSILQVYDTLDLATIGVSENMLYDIIPVIGSPASGAEVEVNATTFSVDCGSLPGIAQANFQIPDSGSEEGIPQYTFGLNGGRYSASLVPMGPNQFQVVPLVDNNEDPTDYKSMVVVASTYTVVNSTGNNVTATSINPVWEITPEGSTVPDENISNVVLIGCNFNVQNSTAFVDAQSRSVVHYSAPPNSKSQGEWTDPGIQSDPLLQEFFEYFVQNEPIAQDTMVYEVSVTNVTSNATYIPSPSLLEWFLYTDISAKEDPNLYGTLDSVSAEQLSSSLGRAYAAVLWYYNSVTSLSLAFNETGAIRERGQAAIPSLNFQERLSVNKISLFAGLGASCALFVLAVVMIARSVSFTKDVVHHDVSGLLPILWLLGHEPRLAAIEEPDLDALRAAGMHIVTGIDSLRRRMGSSKGMTEDDVVEEYELEYPNSGPRSQAFDPLLTRIENVATDRTSHVFTQGYSKDILYSLFEQTRCLAERGTKQLLGLGNSFVRVQNAYNIPLRNTVRRSFLLYWSTRGTVGTRLMATVSRKCARVDSSMDEGFTSSSCETAEWPASNSAMSAAREFLKSCALARLPTLLVPDKDADGLCGTMIIYRTLLALGLPTAHLHVHFVEKGSNVHRDDERKRMEAYGAQYVVVVDQGSRKSGPIVRGEDVKTLIIDHHWSEQFPEGATVLSAARHSPIATSSTLAFMLCRPLIESIPSGKDNFKRQIDYLCAIGTYGDLGTSFAFSPPWPEADMKRAIKEWGKKRLTDAVGLLNAPRRTATYDVESAWNALLSSPPPSIATNTRLKAARAEVNGEINRITSGAQIHPVIATRWTSTLKSSKLEIVMCANDGYLPGMINFSCRVAKCAKERARMSTKREDEGAADPGANAREGAGEVNIIDVLRGYASREPGLLESMGDDFARGHREASGGIVRTEDFERLWSIMQSSEPQSPPRKKQKRAEVQKNTLDGMSSYAIEPKTALVVLTLGFIVYGALSSLWAYHYRSKMPPGPRGLPFFGNLFQLTKEQWLLYAEWKEQYGSIFSLDLAEQPVVVVNDFQTAADLVDRRSAIYSSRPWFIMSCEILTGGLFFGLLPYGNK
ncbi:hypothetical protein NM688_g7102 [Phlebia brevispora]|uniref:Uncharacterized protein n=1 Tax=Phlebia brevispora TaxID=194682 RepID=A0ACC1S9J7_9APHY|nr:hypothetical protein NM688_g7102 [Phlebia brevispora]